MVGRASPHSAQIRASARSPLDSLVPPELTRLKMSTTTSTVLSAPVIASMWKARSRMLRSRAIRSTYSANRSRVSVALSRA